MVPPSPTTRSECSLCLAINKKPYNNTPQLLIKMKGIVLAGGSGTRLYPSPKGEQTAASHLRQADDLYPLSTLMLAG
jgi:hypothetical protein